MLFLLTSASSREFRVHRAGSQLKTTYPTRQGTGNRGTLTHQGTGKTWFPDASGYHESEMLSHLHLDWPKAGVAG